MAHKHHKHHYPLGFPGVTEPEGAEKLTHFPSAMEGAKRLPQLHEPLRRKKEY